MDFPFLNKKIDLGNHFELFVAAIAKEQPSHHCVS